MKSKFVLSLIIVVLMAIFAGINLAMAYTAPYRWSSSPVAYDYSALTVDWRNVALFGAQQWNDVSPSSFTMSSLMSGSNDVYMSSIDGSGGTLGITSRWTSDGYHLSQATIRFDDAESWNLGSGSPWPWQIDARSVATHEFGHFAGLGHSSNCGWNPATMCPSTSSGSTQWRTLEQDDRNGLNANYP
jgi:hypothetical protein